MDPKQTENKMSTKKLLLKSSQSWLLSSVCVVLCVVMFARNEIIFSEFREQETRVRQLEDKVYRLIKAQKNLKPRDGHIDQSTRRVRREITTKIRLDDIRQEIRHQIMSLNTTKYCPFRGCSGTNGPPGPSGPTGPIGKRGPRGKRGKRGPRGRKGFPGPSGPPGRHGKQGMMGLPGPKGPMGMKGTKGDKGDPGLSISVPDVIASPSHSIAIVNQSAEFFCSTTGNPKPDLSWQRDGKELPLHWKTNKEGRAMVRHVKYSDAGNLTCVAKNVLGKGRQDVILTVHGPPSFKHTPNTSIIGFESCDVTMTCTAYGNPKPVVTWSKALRLPPSRSRVFSNGTLLVRGLKTMDSGTYVCKAQNKFGIVKHFTSLYVDRLTGISPVSSDCWRMNSEPSGTWTQTGSVDAIELTVDHDVLLLGYRLWGVASGFGRHDVTIQVKDNQGRKLGKKKGIYQTVSTQKTFTVKFARPVELKRGVRYTTSVLLKGPSAHRGKGGHQTVVCNGITVVFSSSSENTNGSSIKYGQIPALILGKAGMKC